MLVQSRTLERLIDSPQLMTPELPRIVILPSMDCEDHATFVIACESKVKTLEYFALRGLNPFPTIHTAEFPAEHIALVYDSGDSVSCQDMIGLSVSHDSRSPINRLVNSYRGAGFDGVLQHIAYSVAATENFADVRAELERQKVEFMTPILEYTDRNGAALRQMFVACTQPYGPFIEVVQRTNGTDGLPFRGFSPRQIDDLYRYYNTHSRKLEDCMTREGNG